MIACLPRDKVDWSLVPCFHISRERRSHSRRDKSYGLVASACSWLCCKYSFVFPVSSLLLLRLFVSLLLLAFASYLCVSNCPFLCFRICCHLGVLASYSMHIWCRSFYHPFALTCCDIMSLSLRLPLACCCLCHCPCFYWCPCYCMCLLLSYCSVISLRICIRVRLCVCRRFCPFVWLCL